MKILLRDGETAVVGYGSLLSAASISKTIGRPYDGPFVRCRVDGWRRSWDVSMPNEAFYFVDDGRRVYPRCILYLNTSPKAGAHINAVVFVVAGDELRAMRDREWIYREEIVTPLIRGLEIEGGDAVMYIGREEHVVHDPASRDDAAVRASYLRILNTSLQSTPPEFRAEYEATTDPVPVKLIVEDILDPERPTPWERAGVGYRPQME